jgi:cytochrome P450
MLKTFSPMDLQDPYPGYAALREQGPVLRSEAFFGGAWLLSRYADVANALKDERLSARRTGGWLADTDQSARQDLAPFQKLFARALLFQDAPDHPRLRQVLAPGFRASNWQALEQRITAHVDAVLDALPAGPFDFMAQVARPVPARVVADLMGLEDNPADEFVHWSDDIAAFIGHPDPDLALAQRAQHSALAMADMFRLALVQRRRDPALAHASDWMSLLLQAKSRGEIQSTEELLAQCVMLLFAGHETTRHLLGNGVHALLSTPGAWAQLQANPQLLPSAVRELLRFDSPVQYSGRRVSQTHTLHGHKLERGELVITLIGAANRDPSVYTLPDELQLNRKEAAHLSFGTGPHVCIGAALTYLEAQAVLSSLLRRWRDAPRLAAPPVRQINPLYRGFERLELVGSCDVSHCG